MSKRKKIKEKKLTQKDRIERSTLHDLEGPLQSFAT
jgi:hypothetical protein